MNATRKDEQVATTDTLVERLRVLSGGPDSCPECRDERFTGVAQHPHTCVTMRQAADRLDAIATPTDEDLVARLREAWLPFKTGDGRSVEISALLNEAADFIGGGGGPSEERLPAELQNVAVEHIKNHIGPHAYSSCPQCLGILRDIAYALDDPLQTMSDLRGSEEGNHAQD